MVFLEAVSVLVRWDYGFFYGAALHCLGVWNVILSGRFCVYDLYLCQSADLWGTLSRDGLP